MKNLIIKIYIYCKKVKRKTRYMVLKIKSIFSFINTKSTNLLIENDLYALKNVEKYRKLNKPNKKIHLKENSIDLSIIIPVYNAEKTIDICIKSIVNQKTSCNFEILCINDGSTDNSSEIIDSIKDKRLKIYNQKNGGAAKARNTGLSNAMGKYIMFVDSDDFLPNENVIETLLMQANLKSADIVAGNIEKYIEKSDLTVYNIKHRNTTTNDLLKMCSLTEGAPWGKIYKKDLWEKIVFPEGVEIEDCIIFLNIYPKATKFVYINKSIYCFRSNNNSLYKRTQKDYKCIDSFWSIYLSYKMLDNKNNMTIEHIQLFIWHLSAIMSARIRSIKNIELKKSIIILARNLINEIIDNSRYTKKDILGKCNCMYKKMFAILEKGTVEEWSQISEMILLSGKIM